MTRRDERPGAPGDDDRSRPDNDREPSSSTDRPRVGPPPSTGPVLRRHGLRWSAAAALVLTLGTLGVLSWQHWARPDATAGPATSRPGGSAAVPVPRKPARSIVRVMGSAPECHESRRSAGFVYAPERVLTPAHIVAGTRADLTVTARDDVPRRATVVLYDPRRDLAVLHVPGLTAPSLRWDRTGSSGDDVVVAGFDKSTAVLTSRRGTIRAEDPATGPDIYHRSRITRWVYLIDLTGADMGSIDTGGPLLATTGGVYGMVFAAHLDEPNSGFALTATELSAPAEAGRTRTKAVSTRGCLA